MKIQTLVLAIVLGFVSLSAQAQVTSNSGSNSNAQTSSGANAGANVGAQGVSGVNAIVNENAANHMAEDVVSKSQVPISVGGYGSFSQASCKVSAGGGLTTRAVSGILDIPVSDINCEHTVRGDAQGRAAEQAMKFGDRPQYLADRGAAEAAYCSADDEAKQQCIDAGTVIAISKDHRGHIKIAPVMNGASPIDVARDNWKRGFTTMDYSNLQGAASAPTQQPQPNVSAQKAPATGAVSNTQASVSGGNYWTQEPWVQRNLH
jgi:hypothetical protein